MIGFDGSSLVLLNKISAMAPPRKKQKVAVRKAEPTTNGETITEDEPTSGPAAQEGIPALPFKPITDDEKQDWGGFCEIESDPSFFNAILHDWGVRGAKVREVLGLDEDLLLLLPRPILGFVFLYRYHDLVKNNQEASCPPHVWFANQTHDFACATVSLLNIVFNIPSLDLGENLAQFKEYTKEFTPAARGDQVGHWSFVKSVHNSFARRMDISNIDLGLKNQYDDRNKKNKTQSQDKKKRKMPKKNKGKRKTKGVVSDEDWEEDSEESNAAYHFVAFVPIEGEVWRLDGLNRQPEKLPGRYEPESFEEMSKQNDGGSNEQTACKETEEAQTNGTKHAEPPQTQPETTEKSPSWLDIALPHLQEMMLSVESGGGMEFNLLALVQDPLTNHKRQLAQDIESLRVLEEAMDEAHSSPRWRILVLNDEETKLDTCADGFAKMPGKVVRISDSRTEIDLPVDATDLPTIKPSSTVEACCVDPREADFSNLLVTWHKTVRQLTSNAAAVRDDLDTAAQDLEKARQRRSDYSPVIWTWLKMLSEKEGVLREMIEIMEASV